MVHYGGKDHPENDGFDYRGNVKKISAQEQSRREAFVLREATEFAQRRNEEMRGLNHASEAMLREAVESNLMEDETPPGEIMDSISRLGDKVSFLSKSLVTLLDKLEAVSTYPRDSVEKSYAVEDEVFTTEVGTRLYHIRKEVQIIIIRINEASERINI